MREANTEIVIAVQTLKAKLSAITMNPCFKYRPRYRPISPFLPVTDTIWENRLPYRLQQKTADI